MTHFPMLCKARWAQMRAERAHTFLATPSRMQNHRSKERRAAQRRLYSRLSTLKRRTSCGRGTPCVNTISEAIPSIMLRETPDDRRVAAPGLQGQSGISGILAVSDLQSHHRAGGNHPRSFWDPLLHIKLGFQATTLLKRGT